jgi:hypothetical protein
VGRLIGIALLALGAPALITAGPAGADAGHHKHPSIVIREFGGAQHPGDQLSVLGRIRHAPGRTRLALQVRGGTSGPWATVARTHPGPGGAFALRWRVPRNSSLTLVLRVVALRSGHVVARSTQMFEPLAPPPRPCAPPSAPGTLPAGDGAVQGGLYWEGGPAPGRGPNCWSSAYTVTATDSGGAVAASEAVAAGRSYTLVLPAGSYRLTAENCKGTATVTAGAITHADVVCAYP